MMKILNLFIALMLVACTTSAGSAGSTQPYSSVTVNQLIVHPKQYWGKKVSFSGYIYFPLLDGTPQVPMIFADRTSFIHKDSDNAVALTSYLRSCPTENIEDLKSVVESLQGTFVSISGVFGENLKGDFGEMPAGGISVGAISRITRSYYDEEGRDLGLSEQELTVCHHRD